MSAVNPTSQFLTSNTKNKRNIKIESDGVLLNFYLYFRLVPPWEISFRFLRLSFGISQRRIGGCGHPDHILCCLLCLCLRLRVRMRGRSIPSSLSFTSTLLKSAYFSVLPFPPSPQMVLLKSGVVVVVVVIPTNMRPHPGREV